MPHTPGPWESVRCGKTENKRNLVEFQIRSTQGEGLSACVAWTDEVRAEQAEQTEANARLIAAAPELLAALEAALSKMESDESQIEGEWGSSLSLEELEKDGSLSAEIITARAVIAKARGA
jgi:hypothetical protein